MKALCITLLLVGYTHIVKAQAGEKYFKKAEKYFKKAANDKDPVNFSIAHDYINQAIEADPTNDKYYYLRAKILFEDDEVGLEGINKAILLNPKEPLYYELRASMLNYFHQDYALALKNVDMALELKKKDSELYMFRAAMLEQLGRYSEGNDAVRNAIELDKENEYYYYYLGNLHHLNNETQLACDNWAISMGKGLSIAQDSVANYCE